MHKINFCNVSFSVILPRSRSEAGGETEADMTKSTVLVTGSNATRIELQSGGSAAIGQTRSISRPT
jgi:hypothetical protein